MVVQDFMTIPSLDAITFGKYTKHFVAQAAIDLAQQLVSLDQLLSVHVHHALATVPRASSRVATKSEAA